MTTRRWHIIVSVYIQRRSRGLPKRFFRDQLQRPRNCAFWVVTGCGGWEGLLARVPPGPRPLLSRVLFNDAKGQTAALCHLCMSSFLFTRLLHVRHLRTGTVAPASLDATLHMTCAKVEFEILTERCMVTVDQQENHHSYHLLSTLWDRHFIYV